MEFLETHTGKDAKAVWKNDIDVPGKEEAIEKSDDESDDEDEENDDSDKNTGKEKGKIFSYFFLFFFIKYVLLSNIDFLYIFE